MSSFANAKATHIFFQQKILAYVPYLMISFTDDIVSFEQLGPGKATVKEDSQSIAPIENINKQLYTHFTSHWKTTQPVQSSPLR